MTTTTRTALGRAMNIIQIYEGDKTHFLKTPVAYAYEILKEAFDQEPTKLEETFVRFEDFMNGGTGCDGPYCPSCTAERADHFSCSKCGKTSDDFARPIALGTTIEIDGKYFDIRIEEIKKEAVENRSQQTDESKKQDVEDEAEFERGMSGEDERMGKIVTNVATQILYDRSKSKQGLGPGYIEGGIWHPYETEEEERS